MKQHGCFGADKNCSKVREPLHELTWQWGKLYQASFLNFLRDRPSVTAAALLEGRAGGQQLWKQTAGDCLQASKSQVFGDKWRCLKCFKVLEDFESLAVHEKVTQTVQTQANAKTITRNASPGRKNERKVKTAKIQKDGGVDSNDIKKLKIVSRWAINEENADRCLL